MKPIKTKTIQEVERPPFAEWWCYIHNITPTSPIKRKLGTMAMLRSLKIEATAFVKTTPTAKAPEPEKTYLSKVFLNIKNIIIKL